MAKNNDGLGFDFDAEDPFGDFDASGGSSGKGQQKKTFFRDLASGFGIGVHTSIKNYMPPVAETEESAVEMAQQMREQAQSIKQNMNRVGGYIKGVSDDVKDVLKDIKGQKTLADKIHAAEKGVNQTKKNLAYKLDPELAESMDFDKMFGEDDIESSSAGPAAREQAEVRGTTSDRSEDSLIRERDEMFGIGREGSIGGYRGPIATSPSGTGGDKKIIKKQAVIVTGGGKENAIANQALLEAVIVTGAKQIANQNKLWKRQLVLDTKRHMQMMHALEQISHATTIVAKFDAEMLGPHLKTYSDYFAKATAQLTDMIDLTRGDGSKSVSPIAQLLSGARSKFAKKNVSEFITSSGGFDLGGLYGHATKQVKEMGSMYGLDAITGLKDMLPMMLMGGSGKGFAHGLGKILGQVATAPFKKQLRGMSDKLSVKIPAAMVKANYKMKSSDNPFLQGIAELLNIDTGTKSTVNVSTTNRRVPFDMVTRKSIVEVIPGLLADIHSAISGQEKKVFDHTTGQFTTASDMRNRLQSQIDVAGTGSMWETRSSLTSRDNSKFATASARFGVSKRDFEKDLDIIFKNIMVSGTFFDPAAIITDDKKIAMLSRGCKNPNSFMIFLNAWDGIDDESKSNFYLNIERGKISRRTELTRQEINMIEYGQGSTMGANIVEDSIVELASKKHDLSKISGNQGAFDLRGEKKYKQMQLENVEIDKKIAALKATAAVQGEGSTGLGEMSGSPLEKIYDLLYQGILVYPQLGVGIPPHLKRIREVKAAQEKEKTRLEDEQKKLKAEVEDLSKQIEVDRAKTDRDTRERNKMTMIERTRATLGKTVNEKIDNSAPGKWLAKRKEEASKTAFGKALASVKDSISGTIGSVDKLIDNHIGEQGFDIAGAVKEIAQNAKVQQAKDAVSATTDKGANVLKTLNDVRKEKGLIAAGKAAFGMTKDAASVTFGKGKAAIQKKIDEEFDKFKTTVTYAKAVELMGDAKEVYRTALQPGGIQVLKDRVKEYTQTKLTPVKTVLESKLPIQQAKDAVSEFQKSPVFVQAVKLTGDAKSVIELAKTKEGRTQLETLVKLKLSETGETLTGKAKESAQLVGNSVALGLAHSAQKYGVNSEGAKKAINELKSGKLSPLGMLRTTFGLLGEKLNIALFGQYEDPKTAKMGVVRRALWVTKELVKNVQDFMLGKKDGKRWGLLYKLASPAMRFFEDFRHQFMEKIGIPFKFIGKSLATRMKWLVRDVKNTLGRVGKGVKEKLSGALDWLSKRSGIKAGKGGLLGGAFGLASKLTGVATGIIGGTVNFGVNREKRKLQQLVAQGKLSIEEYDEKVGELEANLDSEKKRHNEQNAKLDEYASSLTDKKLNSLGFKGQRDELKSLEEKVKGMSYAEETKEFKEKRKIKKANEKINKKFQKFDKLYQETGDEKYRAEAEKYKLSDDQLKAGLTTRELAQRERDDLLRKAEKAHKEQQLERDKKQEEMADDTKEIRTQITAVAGLLGGKVAQDKPLQVQEVSFLEKKFPKPDEAEAKKVDDHIDIKTGYEEGSLEDSIADKQREIAEKANNVVAKTSEPMLTETTTQTGQLEEIKEDMKQLVKLQKKEIDLEEKQGKGKWIDRAIEVGSTAALVTAGGKKAGLFKTLFGKGTRIRGPGGKFITKSGGLKGFFQGLKSAVRYSKLGRNVSAGVKGAKSGKGFFKEFIRSSKRISSINKATKAARVASTAAKGGKLAQLAAKGGKLGQAATKVSKLGKFGKIAGVTLGAVASAMMLKQAWDKGKQKRAAMAQAKQERGTMGAIGELTGLDSFDSSELNADGTKKSLEQQSMDNFKAGRYLVRGQAMKDAKNVAGVATKIPVVAKGVAQGGSKAALALARVAGEGSKLATKAPKIAGMLVKLEQTIWKVLSNPKIAKYISNEAAKRIVSGVVKEAGKNAGKGAAKGALGAVLGAATGGIALVAFAVADFVVGFNNTGNFFKMPPGEQPTTGMKVASGIASALSGLVFGLIPPAWLARTVYEIVGGKEARSKMSELEQKRNAYTEGMKSMGYDTFTPEALAEVDNRTVGTRFFDALPGGKKRREQREAKLLGMDLETYARFKEDRKTYETNMVSQGQANMRRAIANKIAETGANSKEMLDEVAKTGVIGGYHSDALGKHNYDDVGRYIDISVIERKAAQGDTMFSVVILPEAQDIISGKIKDFSPEAKKHLAMLGFGTMLRTSAVDKQMQNIAAGMIPGVNIPESAENMSLEDIKAHEAKLDKKEKVSLSKWWGKRLAKMKNRMADFKEARKKFAEKAVDSFYSITGKLGNLKDYVTSGDMWADVKDTAEKIKDKIVAGFNTAIDGVKNAISAVGDFISGLWHKITSFVTELPGKVADFVTSIPGNVMNWGKDKLNKLSNWWHSENTDFNEGYNSTIQDNAKNVSGAELALSAHPVAGAVQATVGLGKDVGDAAKQAMSIEDQAKAAFEAYPIDPKTRPGSSNIYRTVGNKAMTVRDFVTECVKNKSVPGVQSGMQNGADSYNPKDKKSRRLRQMQNRMADANPFADIINSIRSNAFSILGRQDEDTSTTTGDGGGTPAAYTGTFNPSELENIQTSQQASGYFWSNATKGLNAYLTDRLRAGDTQFYEKLADKVKDPTSMGQNKDIETLNPIFKQKVKALQDDPGVKAIGGLRIREARRSPLTQLAYFAQGRSRDTNFMDRMFQKAGLGNKAWSYNQPNTQTIGSKHFSGYAFDAEDYGKPNDYYDKLGSIAKKYGIEWGGYWDGNFKDRPHFEMPSSQISRPAIPQSVTAQSGMQNGADSYNPKLIEANTPTSVNYMKDQNSKIEESLDLKRLMEHSEKMINVLHSDNIRIIELLSETLEFHTQTFTEEAPMREYYRSQGGSKGSPVKSAFASTLKNITGGSMNKKNMDIPMHTSKT